MGIALQSGLIILIMLVIMLIAGVPIAVALGVSSVCAILPIMSMDVAVLTGCQRIFSGISVAACLSSVCHSNRYGIGICYLFLIFQNRNITDFYGKSNAGDISTVRVHMVSGISIHHTGSS